jgi:RecA-family ATPase
MTAKQSPVKAVVSALEVAKRWPIFPCNPAVDKESGAKKPFAMHGFKDATQDPNIIRKWWSANPQAMIGVPTGAVTGFWVVDVDVKTDSSAVETWEEWVREGGLSPTRMHKTPRGGQHYLFRYDPAHPVGSSTGKLHEFMDVRGDGGYVVVPPSLRADGKAYEVASDLEIAEAPDWLYARIKSLQRDPEEEEEKPEHGKVSTEMVREALRVISADSYDDWYKIAAAIRRELGDAGFALFDEWSRKSRKHNAAECAQKWSEVSDISQIKAGTIFMYADKADRTWRDRWDEKQPNARPYRPLRHYVSDFSTWDDEPATLPVYAVSGRVPAGETTLFRGEGGAGKSIIGLHLCVAAALSRTWLGVEPRGGAAVFVDAEDKSGVMRYRGERILEHYEVKWRDVRQKLHLVSLKGEDSVLAAVGRRSSRIEPTKRYLELRELVGDVKPSVMVLASIANIFAGSEIDRMQVQQFISLLDGLAMIANSGLVLIGHPSLTGISSGSGESGSTQWHNAVRARMVLSSVGEVDPNLRKLEFRKNQYGPLSESMTLRWQRGLFLPLEMKDADGNVLTRRAVARSVFMILLRRFNEQGRFVNVSTSKAYAPHVFETEKEAKSELLTKRELKEAMDSLLDDKSILLESYGRKDRDAKRLIINTAKTADKSEDELPF